MMNAQDIKNGTCIRMDGRLYFVIDFLHVKPGKGNTFMRTTLKDVVDGRVLERRFNIGEKLEDVRVERRPYQYLYKEGDNYIFMNQETFDQHPIAHDLINGANFLLEGMVLEVVSDASTDTVLFTNMPTKVFATYLIQNKFCPGLVLRQRAHGGLRGGLQGQHGRLQPDRGRRHRHPGRGLGEHQGVEQHDHPRPDEHLGLRGRALRRLQRARQQRRLHLQRELVQGARPDLGHHGHEHLQQHPVIRADGPRGRLRDRKSVV